VADGFSGTNKAAGIAVAPGGGFLYVSNRGDDALTVFAIDAGGWLARRARVPTGGRTPRHFAIDPSGRWLIAANQDSGSVVVFRLDAETGLPPDAGTPAAVPSPVCIAVFLARSAPGPDEGYAKE
jgi:6-phosphogluconolactonase